MKVRITDIQHFCLHDGPGIRTTVFLKGCSLRCPWCANPECISFEIEDDFGYDVSLDYLEGEVLKDECYYSMNDGGVTFSGGEPLLQIKNLIGLLESLNSRNINVCFETSLFVNKDLLGLAIPYADEFIVDIKILSPDECREVLGGDINVYFDNLKLLKNENKKIIFRMPLIPKYILNDENLTLVIDFLKEYSDYPVEIFGIHNLAEDKYRKLNRTQYYEKVDDETVSMVLDELKRVIDDVNLMEF